MRAPGCTRALSSTFPGSGGRIQRSLQHHDLSYNSRRSIPPSRCHAGHHRVIAGFRGPGNEVHLMGCPASQIAILWSSPAPYDVARCRSHFAATCQAGTIPDARSAADAFKQGMRILAGPCRTSGDQIRSPGVDSAFRAPLASARSAESGALRQPNPRRPGG